jgi:hypothetical protein
MFGMFITFLGVTKSIRKNKFIQNKMQMIFPRKMENVNYIYFTKRYQTRAKN